MRPTATDGSSHGGVPISVTSPLRRLPDDQQRTMPSRRDRFGVTAILATLPNYPDPTTPAVHPDTGNFESVGQILGRLAYEHQRRLSRWQRFTRWLRG